MKTVENLELFKKLRKHIFAIIIAVVVAMLITTISFSASALSDLFEQPAAAAADPLSVGFSVTESDMMGTFANSTYNLLLEDGMGKLINAEHGVEDEMFTWEFDESGDIVFDVYWVAGGSPGFPIFQSILKGKTGVISADGNRIVVGDMTFARNLSVNYTA